MTSKRISLTLALLSVLVVAGLGVWGWSLDPEHAARWAGFALFLPALWGFIELAQFRGKDRVVAEAIMNWHRRVIAWVGLLIAVGVSFQLAISADLLDADWGPIARRITGVIFGTGMVLWGNYLPKGLSPWSVEEEPFNWQRVHRFAGWVASLGGIALVMVWLVFPLERARLATVGIVGTCVVLVLGRKLLSLAARSRRRPPVAQ